MNAAMTNERIFFAFFIFLSSLYYFHDDTRHRLVIVAIRYNYTDLVVAPVNGFEPDAAKPVFRSSTKTRRLQRVYNAAVRGHVDIRTQ